ncbi:ABC transporter substrate-binding protein [Streptomyces sp. NBC_00347]|uniref:ABC transporter substrate-binding protein n=1 Tax=Streptomyces sp. NBC_00347 TaxID=2975721 RepID=UPI0022558421|nr:ABC transporter substrate-binding protein [Streptomyces sp. NBC_00347]MCX5126734.1 ABC transporter substrate-binding protein [Streptomyces sp. NBC_00347]
MTKHLLLSRRSLAVLAAGLVAATTLTACGGASKPPSTADGKRKVTLTLNWSPYGEHAPLYYGLEKGYFAAEGIELTITPGTGSGNTIKAVGQGHTDFGWADTSPLLHAADSGMPVKSAGVFLQKGPASLEFFADRNIKTPQDLKGKKVAGTAGDAMWATFPAWLEINGLKPADVQLVNVDAAGKIAALNEGKVDAIMGFFHDQAPTIEAKSGKQVDVMLYADTGLNLLGTGLVANEKTIASDKDLVQKMVRAVQKSWAEAVKDPAAAVKAMGGKADLAPPEDVMRKQLDKAVPLLQLEKAGAPGVNTEQQWTDMIKLLKDTAGLKKAGPAADYWDASFAKAAR